MNNYGESKEMKYWWMKVKVVIDSNCLNNFFNR